MRKNNLPDFGTVDYFKLIAKRYRLKASIADDKGKKAEYLSRARAAEYHVNLYTRRRQEVSSVQNNKRVRSLPPSIENFLIDRDASSKIIYA